MSSRTRLILVFFCFTCLYDVVKCQQLSCYYCEETFTDKWDPYTDCQVYPKNTPMKPCLDSEIYCMVEKATVKGMTISMKRRCTDECYYGCYGQNFGLTTWTCTSCCQTTGCNTDNSASNLVILSSHIFITITCCLLRSLL